MVDFDQAEYNDFESCIRAQLCEKILCGCTEHWKISVNQVSDIVTKSKEEQRMFRHIGHGIQHLKNKTDSKVAFNVLCGVKNVVEAKHLLSPDLAATSNQETNVHQSKSAHWVKWWSRENTENVL